MWRARSDSGGSEVPAEDDLGLDSLMMFDFNNAFWSEFGEREEP